jgi:hypothetical protein
MQIPSDKDVEAAYQSLLSTIEDLHSLTKMDQQPETRVEAVRALERFGMMVSREIDRIETKMQDQASRF